MAAFDNLLRCNSYKAVYLYETNSAYIWQDGRCQYYPSLSINEVYELRLLSKRAARMFHIPYKVFGFSS